MGNLAHAITRKWVAGILALVAILGAGAIIGVVGQAEGPPTAVAALPDGTDSKAAAELRAELPEAEGPAAVVLYSSDARCRGRPVLPPPWRRTELPPRCSSP